MTRKILIATAWAVLLLAAVMNEARAQYVQPQSGHQSILSCLGRLNADGFECLPPGYQIVHWTIGPRDTPVDSLGTNWPLASVAALVRVEFSVPVYIGGSLSPEPRFDLMLPPDVLDGRIFVAPIMSTLTTLDTLQLGFEVDILTGEPLDVGHYGERLGAWYAEHDNPEGGE